VKDVDPIVRMVEAGGVYYNIAGESPAEIFSDAVHQLALPRGVDPLVLLQGLREREALMTTGIGNGIALPHPRVPLVASDADERIYVCFLDRAIDFAALDGVPIYVLFVILSARPQSHLKTLSSLSYLMQSEAFNSLLRNKPDTQELIRAIKKYL